MEGLTGGREIEVGIRPESLRLIHDDDARDGIQFDADVLRIQSMGGARQIDFAVGSRHLTAMLPIAEGPPRGESCRLFVRAEDVHLFDADNGHAVGPRRGGS